MTPGAPDPPVPSVPSDDAAWPSRLARLERLAPLVPVLIGLALVACGAPWLLFGGGPTGGDWPMHHSDAVATADALRRVDFQLWLDNAGGGHPAGLTHPLLPALLLALPVACGVDVHTAAAAFVLLLLGLRPLVVYAGLGLCGLRPLDRLLAVALMAGLSSTSSWGQSPTSLLVGGLHAQALSATLLPLAMGALVAAMAGPLSRWSIVRAATLAALVVHAHPMAALWLSATGTVIVVVVGVAGSAPVLSASLRMLALGAPSTRERRARRSEPKARRKGEHPNHQRCVVQERWDLPWCAHLVRPWRRRGVHNGGA